MTKDIIGIRDEQTKMKDHLSSVQLIQQTDSSLLRLMSIRMGIMLPDPNKAEVAASKGGNPIPLPPPKTAAPDAADLPPSVQPQTQSSDAAGFTVSAPPGARHEPRDSAQRASKRRSPSPTITTNSRWVLIPLGYQPYHAPEWSVARNTFKDWQADERLIVSLIDHHGEEELKPFVVRQQYIHTSQDNADSVMAAALALKR